MQTFGSQMSIDEMQTHCANYYNLTGPSLKYNCTLSYNFISKLHVTPVNFFLQWNSTSCQYCKNESAKLFLSLSLFYLVLDTIPERSNTLIVDLSLRGFKRVDVIIYNDVVGHIALQGDTSVLVCMFHNDNQSYFVSVSFY